MHLPLPVSPLSNSCQHRPLSAAETTPGSISCVCQCRRSLASINTYLPLTGTRAGGPQMKPSRRFRRHRTAPPRHVASRQRPAAPRAAGRSVHSRHVARGARRGSWRILRGAPGARDNTGGSRPGAALQPSSAAGRRCGTDKAAFQRGSFIGAARKLPVLFGRESAAASSPSGRKGIRRARRRHTARGAGGGQRSIQQLECRVAVRGLFAVLKVHTEMGTMDNRAICWTNIQL